MEYLITPPETTDWQINENELTKNLEKSWSKIKIKTISNPDDYYCLEWVIIIPETGQRLDGALHRDLQGISLDGYIKDCAAFAVWFRSLVSPSQQLVFYDQGYNSHIELQENTTELEIVEPFLSLV
ncbi:hypothetical protein VB715_19405 [Crocosphaera sp. UHCC 0190]|uniref:hypothetical protein n=1 Tax=unclassified Crocosphaera TaxID=2623705 RepID=UPI002B1ED7DD|nr:MULTISPECIES: hypothetical protein [unclassified Crocosphaera]MEA5511945.1 hypothetical protein [Crocosphaera sp. UHCC 0190]MEA5536646.1 hypothetical protein [Crocosphaera sp. XPORK-15E]